MNAVEEPILESTVAAAVTTNGAAVVPGQPRMTSAKGSATPTNTPVNPPAKKKKPPVLLFVLLFAVIVGGAIAAVYAFYAARYQSTDDAYIEGRVINISPQISARVAKVLVDDNNFVHKDQVLVELDTTDYEVALEQAKGTLSAMEGKWQQAESEINEAIATRNEAAAEVEVAEANSKNAIADYNRFTELARKNAGAVSKQQMDAAVAAWESGTAQVNQAKAKLANADAEIATKKATAVAAKGDREKAAADVRKAEVNLQYCVIKAPEDGKITRKNVEPGSYVQTGEQLLAVVPTEVWVVANVKETQLEKMRVGQPVEITVDAYPGLDLHGKLESIQSGTGSRFSMLPAENATGNYVKVVQRVPVKIVLSEQNQDKDRLLTPGMSVLPVVDVR
jgi:membrane fusion protein (multidrug efflux system)